MSNPFGGFTTFAIHQDGGENVGNPALKKAKKEEILPKVQGLKRTALGSLTNNGRAQTFRGSKPFTKGVSQDGLCDLQQNENITKQTSKCAAFGVGGAGGMPFSIHMDDPSPTAPAPLIPIASNDSKFSLDLDAGVAGLSRPALSTLQPAVFKSQPSILDSPMLLDTSVDLQTLKEEEQKETIEERMNKILTVPEYADEIYSYLREAELRNRAKPGYMKKQPDITNSMRSILVDWLVEVAEEYKLHRETLFLSVNYIDRFLSQMSVLRGKLQLVGAAAMFLAAKYEEIYPPEVGEFVYITDDTYSQSQVLRMEHLILKVLNFDVAVPTVNCFCEKFLKDSKADDTTESLAMYLMELTMPDGETFLKFLPSVVASSCVFLARYILGQQPWSKELAESTCYMPADLQSCVEALHATHLRAPHLAQHAVQDKYKQDKYHQVGLIASPHQLPFNSSAMVE